MAKPPKRKAPSQGQIKKYLKDLGQPPEKVENMKWDKGNRVAVYMLHGAPEPPAGQPDKRIFLGDGGTLVSDPNYTLLGLPLGRLGAALARRAGLGG